VNGIKDEGSDIMACFGFPYFYHAAGLGIAKLLR
jgi:hypothetical protein